MTKYESPPFGQDTEHDKREKRRMNEEWKEKIAALPAAEQKRAKDLELHNVVDGDDAGDEFSNAKIDKTFQDIVKTEAFKKRAIKEMIKILKIDHEEGMTEKVDIILERFPDFVGSPEVQETVKQRIIDDLSDGLVLVDSWRKTDIDAGLSLANRFPDLVKSPEVQEVAKASYINRLTMCDFKHAREIGKVFSIPHDTPEAVSAAKVGIKNSLRIKGLWNALQIAEEFSIQYDTPEFLSVAKEVLVEGGGSKIYHLNANEVTKRFPDLKKFFDTAEKQEVGK